MLSRRHSDADRGGARSADLKCRLAMLDQTTAASSGDGGMAADSTTSGTSEKRPVGSFIGLPYFYDLFLSYGWGPADGSETSLLTQWTAAFHQSLEQELQHIMVGEKPAVFFDRDSRKGLGVNRTDPLPRHLRESSERSAILLIVSSDWYWRSSWCRDERQAWLDSPLRRSDRAKLVPIWTTHNGREHWEACAGLGTAPIGFDFFDPIEKRPLGWMERPASRDPAFNRAIASLSGEIKEQLLLLKDRFLSNEMLDTSQSAVSQALQVLAQKGIAKAEVEAYLENTGRRISSHEVKLEPSTMESILALATMDVGRLKTIFPNAHEKRRPSISPLQQVEEGCNVPSSKLNSSLDID